MKVTTPGFPFVDVFRRMIGDVQLFTDDPVDLLALSSTLACYAARWIKNKRGGTLTMDEWLQHCRIAFNGSDDQRARDILGG